MSLVLLAALSLQAGIAVSRVLGQHSPHHLYLLTSAWLMFATATGWVVARAVFGPGRVSSHRVMGAVFLYLLIALAFASLFALVGFFIPNAFSGINFDDTPALTGTLFYFSFVTQATLGYGDVVPASQVARGLAIVQAIAGQLYLAVMVARLVSLYVRNPRKGDGS